MTHYVITSFIFFIAFDLMSVLSNVYYGYSSFIKNYIIGYLIPSPTLGLCLCMVHLEAKGQPWESFLEHYLPCIVTGLSLRPVTHDFGQTPVNPSCPLSPPPSVLGAEIYMGAGDWTRGLLLVSQAHYQLSHALKMYLWRRPQVAIGILFCLFSPFLGALFPALSLLMPRI